MEHPVTGSLSESGNVIIYYSAHAGLHNILDFVKKQKLGHLAHSKVTPRLVKMQSKKKKYFSLKWDELVSVKHWPGLWIVYR